MARHVTLLPPLFVLVIVLVSVMPPRGLAADIEVLSESPLANGKMLVCWKPIAAASVDNLLIHFHGWAETVKAAFARSDRNGVLVVVNFPGLSSAYSKPFSVDDKLFQKILKDARRAVVQAGSGDLVRDWQQVTLSSFSAGYGAVREILKSPRYFQRIDAIVAADSIYAGLQANQANRQVDQQNMRDFLRFAALATERQKSFIISHSAQPTPYASTTETADYLLRSLRVVRQPDTPVFADVLRQQTRAARGQFVVLGFEGSSGKDHMRHLHHIDLIWKQLPTDSAVSDEQ